jgi:hypothetical protein
MTWPASWFCRCAAGATGVLHLHFVDGDHDRYGGGRNGHSAPRSGWCSRRRLARHHGDDHGCIARASDRIRLRLIFASALHLADALRTEIGGAVVERFGVFRQIREEGVPGKKWPMVGEMMRPMCYIDAGGLVSSRGCDWSLARRVSKCSLALWKLNPPCEPPPSLHF